MLKLEPNTAKRVSAILADKTKQMPESLKPRYGVALLKKMLSYLEENPPQSQEQMSIFERIEQQIALISLDFPLSASHLKNYQQKMKSLEADFLAEYRLKRSFHYRMLISSLGASAGLFLVNFNGLAFPTQFLGLALGGGLGLLLGILLDKKTPRKL